MVCSVPIGSFRRACVRWFSSSKMASSHGISQEEMFSFDLNGFLIVRGALSKEEVDELNRGIDANSDVCHERGEGLRNTRLGTSFSGDGKTGFFSFSFSFSFFFFFFLFSFFFFLFSFFFFLFSFFFFLFSFFLSFLFSFLSPFLFFPTFKITMSPSTPFPGRIDMGKVLGWPSPHREGFRNLLVHPKLVPYLHAFVGKGYRLDHSPLIIKQVIPLPPLLFPP